MKPHLQIEAVTEETILVSMGDQNFDVPRLNYEIWADAHDKRSWCMDYYEGDKTLSNYQGIMDWEEYYQHLAFKVDLQEFLGKTNLTLKINS